MLCRYLREVKNRLGPWWIAYPTGLLGPFVIEFFIRWWVSEKPPDLIDLFGNGQALPPIIIVAGLGAMNIRSSRSSVVTGIKVAARALAVSAFLTGIVYAVRIYELSTGRLDARLQERTVGWSVGIGFVVMVVAAYGHWNAYNLKGNNHAR